MEKIVDSVFNSIFQTKRTITTTEKLFVVISIVGISLISAFVLLSFRA